MSRDEEAAKKLRELVDDGGAIGLSVVLRTEPPMAGHYVVRAHTPGGRWIDYPPEAADGMADAFRYFANMAREQQDARAAGGKAPS